MPKQTPNNQPNSSENGPKTPELDLSTREGALQNYVNQMNRMHQVASALGEEDGAWEDGGIFKSGAVIRSLYEEIDQNPHYQPDESDALIAEYINADLSAVIADKSIDSEKMMQQYPEAENSTEAMFIYLDELSSNLKEHNNSSLGPKFRRKTEKRNGKDVAISKSGLKNIKGNIISNNAIIGGIKKLHEEDVAVKENRELDPESVTLEKFIQETARFNEGKIDQQTFDSVKKSFKAEVDEELKIAAALAAVTSDNKLDLSNEGFTEEISQSTEMQAAINRQRQNIKDAESYLDNTEDSDEPDENSAKPSNMPPVRPQASQQQSQGTTTGATQPNGQNTGASQSAQQQQSANPNTQPGNSTTTTGPNSTSSQHPASGNNGNRTPSNPAPARTSSPGGASTRNHGTNLAPMNMPTNTADLQRNNVNAAARILAESGRRRSANFSKTGGNGAHLNLQNELRKMMEFEKPTWFDSATPEEKLLYTNQYIAHYYTETVRETIDGMAGEKDEKKRKRNRRVIRFGLAAVGFMVGGPVGAATAGAIGLGVTKAMDSEFKNRKKLYNAVNEYMPDDEINTLIAETQVGDTGDIDLNKAFELSAARIQEQFEKGVVKKRQRNIGFAGLKGLAWTGGSIFVAGQAIDAAHVMGDSAYQWASKMSWSGTGTSWDGGLNPNFNYTMHEKPISWKVLEGLFKAGSGRW